MTKVLKVVSLVMATVFVLAGCQPVPLISPSVPENIVIGIVNAPPDANGTMAGEPTNINVFLDAEGVADEYFADPRHFGHQIPAGGRMEIELGGTFERNGVDNDGEFVPFDGNFNLIPLVGLPQVPIAAPAGEGVQHGNYTVSDDGNHTITVTPNGGSGPNGIEGARAREIGIKTLHILSRRGSNTGPAPFRNGPAGTEGIVAVRIYDADNQLLESGEGSVTFAASLGRQVSPINFGLGEPGNTFLAETIHTELVPATGFQIVAPGTRLVSTTRGETFEDGAPYALRFILHEAQELQPDPFPPTLGIPGVGLVVDGERPWLATLMQDRNEDGVLDDADERIGDVVMEGPSDASRGRILQIPDWPLTASGNGVDDPTRSELNVPVQVGAEEGYYGVTVALDGGGQATIYVVTGDHLANVQPWPFNTSDQDRRHLTKDSTCLPVRSLDVTRSSRRVHPIHFNVTPSRVACGHHAVSNLATAAFGVQTAGSTKGILLLLHHLFGALRLYVELLKDE